MEQTKIDPKELRSLPRLVAQYRKPSYKKAILQMITSFWPFLWLLVLSYLVVHYDIIPNRLTIPLWIINAFFLVRIFIIQHDCWHQSFTPNKKINNLIWKVCSYFSMIPYTYRARSHNFHHDHNSELWEYRDIWDILTYTVEEFKQLSKWWKRWYKIFRNPFMLFWVWPTRYILLQNRIPFITLPGRTKEWKSLMTSNAILIAVYAILIILFWWQTVVRAHVPLILSFGTIAIRFFYVQHQHEFTYKAYTEQRDYCMAAIQWSSFYDLPKIVHRLTGNIWYHHIHHLNASIPSYELPRCFNEIEILQKAASRLTFRQSLTCLTSHLRDETQQKMISFKEYYKLYK